MRYRRLRHLKELSRKNLLLLLRSPVKLIAELLIPFVLSAIILLIIRYLSVRDFKPACHLRPHSLPSMGFNSYVASTMCTFNTSCHSQEQTKNFNLDNNLFADPDLMQFLTSVSNLEPDQVNPFQSNTFGYFVSSKPNLEAQLAPFLQESTVDILLRSNLKRYPTLALIEPTCTQDNLEYYVQFPSGHQNDTLLVNELCSLSIVNRTQILQIYYENFDTMKGFTLLLPFLEIYNNWKPLGKKIELMQTVFSQVNMNSLTIMDAPKFANLTTLVCGTERAIDNDLGAFLLSLPNQMNRYMEKVSQYMEDEKRDEPSGDKKPIDTCASLELAKQFSPLIRRLDGLLISRLAIYPNTSTTREMATSISKLTDTIQRMGTAIELWNSTYQFKVKETIETEFTNTRPLLVNCIGDSKLNATERQVCQEILNFFSPKSVELNGTNYEDLINSTTNAGNAILPWIKCIAPDKERITFFDDMSNFTFFLRNNTNTIGLQVDVDNTTGLAVIQLRYEGGIIDNTSKFKVLDRYWSPSPRANAQSDEKYMTSGFMDLQEQVERYLLKYMFNGSSWGAGYPLHDQFGVKIQMMPMPCYVSDTMINSLSTQIPAIMLISWIGTVLSAIGTIIYEKEHRLKEFMKIIGVTNGLQWLAWFIRFFSVALIPIILTVIVLKLGKVLIASNMFVIFLYICVYMFALLMQAFFITTFFNKATFGTVFGFFIYFILNGPYTILEKERVPIAMKYVLCLFPQTAFSLGWKKIGTLEVQGFGVQFSDLLYSRQLDPDPSLGVIMLILLADGIILMILAWYLEEVFPGKYGLPRPWYFPVQYSYWTGKFPETDTETRDEHILEPAEHDYANFEAEPQNCEIGVSVKNLKKRYKRSDKALAVDDLSINFYSNQITSFLGQNGAGKTTTISMLTGLFPATSGTAEILGKNIKTRMPAIRDEMGFCPQHNVLFDDLTVKEHLHFVARIKGEQSKKEEEIEQIIKQLHLLNKLNTRSKNLSGGQKRKLSIAMAFMGFTKVVFLDEPTAGIDPYSRRLIWKLILEQKKDRAIILTTHHMDEADILGDRIAVLKKGQLKAMGSSVFMKSRFGKGLRIIFERDPQVKMDPKMLQKNCEELLTFIRAHCKLASIQEMQPTKLEFLLPTETNCKELSKLFSALEVNSSKLNSLKSNMGIRSFGISDTTLEEIFIELTKDDHSDLVNNSNGGNNVLASSTSSEISLSEAVNKWTPSVLAKYSTQFRASLVKRFHHSRRSKKEWVFAVIFPIFILLNALIFLKIIPDLTIDPPMPIHPWLMRNMSDIRSLDIFTNLDNPQDPVLASLYSMTKTPYGLTGTRCFPQYLVRPFHKDLSCVPPSTDAYNSSQYPFNLNSNNGSYVPCDCSTTGFQVSSRIQKQILGE
ncbi:Retinal-specific ATP-binding cassette transporter [Cichlidogyrus casuarinus]|uniref:Retinal-specific ATP-binding cassette transporter n=1 Tax=Cichlidogyrus casuarinus TaxID=1844966 RepID=A0ABD2QG46_9PLAT